jgi:hypothetical protein
MSTTNHPPSLASPSIALLQSLLAAARPQHSDITNVNWPDSFQFTAPAPTSWIVPGRVCPGVLQNSPTVIPFIAFGIRQISLDDTPLNYRVGITLVNRVLGPTDPKPAPELIRIYLTVHEDTSPLRLATKRSLQRLPEGAKSGSTFHHAKTRSCPVGLDHLPNRHTSQRIDHIQGKHHGFYNFCDGPQQCWQCLQQLLPGGAFCG